eukprot:869311-Prymnesium_polylepis.1
MRVDAGRCGRAARVARAVLCVGASRVLARRAGRVCRPRVCCGARDPWARARRTPLCACTVCVLAWVCGAARRSTASLNA